MIRRLAAIWKNWTDPADARTRLLRLDQLQLAARNADASTRQMPYMTAAVAAGLALWTPWQLMLAWWAGMLLANVTLIRVLAPYVRAPLESGDLRSLTHRFCIANGLQICIFACVAPLAWQDAAPMSQALIVLVLCTAMASVASITGPSRAVFFSDIAPLTLFAVATPIALSGVDGIPMAALALLFAVLMIDNSKGAYRLAENALTLNDQNIALIERLRAADRAKSEFLANMSHELRTPLNAILGFSEVMKDEMMGPMASRAYKGYAADIHVSGQHLLGLVNDILDLAKIEAGRVELVDDVFTMSAIVDASFDLFRLQAEQKSITLLKDVEDDIAIRWDLRAAKQIAINLMSNALKFTPEGGSVTVTSRHQANGWVYVTVRDTGVGIAPDEHATIFESFGQGRHDLAIPEKSTGLGLAIVRGLVELHGGRLTVESDIGQGAAFTIHVPPERVIDLAAERSAA